MRESISNIRAVCPQRYSKPDPIYAKMPLKFFVEKFVKLSFVGRDRLGNETREAMWVIVKSYDTGTKELTGTLCNTPIFQMEYKYGSEVSFTRDEICTVGQPKN